MWADRDDHNGTARDSVRVEVQFLAKVTRNDCEGQKGSMKTTREARGRVTGRRCGVGLWILAGRGRAGGGSAWADGFAVSFMGMAERLAGRRAVFALDLRGRGDSAKPAGPYGMAQHAEDVAAAMGAMGLGTSIIVGHSMGAFVATALAAAAS